MSQRWSLVLAGGDGMRLRPLTAIIAGDLRPKQFCAVLGPETLLEQTLRRATRVSDPARTLLLLTGHHRPYWTPLLGDAPAGRLLVQPANRGTAPAILYGLLRIAAGDPTGAVALLPSDHWVSDDARFMRHVATAFDAIEARPDLVVLLGVAPESAETEYGWIQPAAPVGAGGLLRVRRFVEKPPRQEAARLLRRGGLWNSFVLVARVPALLATLRRSAPDLDGAFAAVAAALGTAAEPEALGALYAALPAADFSQRVLAPCPANLAVLPVRDVEWSDLGHPRRVMLTLARRQMHPEWIERRAATLA